MSLHIAILKNYKHFAPFLFRQNFESACDEEFNNSSTIHWKKGHEIRWQELQNYMQCSFSEELFPLFF